jgi:hypothetical protein
MTFSIALVVVFGVLFSLAYITRRRFGVLTLALAAGSILSDLWSSQATPYIANLGIVIVRPPLVDVVALILTLVPSLILLFSGPAASNKFQRIGGSIVFAVLAVMLMFEPLENALVIDEFGKQVVGYANSCYAIVVTVCLVLSIIDVLQTHVRRSEPKKKSKE